MSVTVSKSEIKGLIDAVRKGDDFEASVNAALDAFEDAGVEHRLQRLRLLARKGNGRGWMACDIERVACESGLLSWSDLPEHARALALHARLAEVDTLDVGAVSYERRHDRKSLAAKARKLFKALGIKGVSVTTPNYSMASGVDVRLPDRLDVKADYDPFRGDRCEAREANAEARRKVQRILLAAFPNTDDRSDSMADYFDFVWSVN